MSDASVPPWERSARFWEASARNLTQSAVQSEGEGHLMLQIVELHRADPNTPAARVREARRRLGQALLEHGASERQRAEAHLQRAEQIRRQKTATPT